jgi:transcriptional regulator with XRE-family HTH domain
MSETMGERIAQLRQSKNWTQTDLAKILRVTRMSVIQWETDITLNIRPNHLLTLAKVFGTDPYFLVYGAARQPKEGWPMVPVK